MEQVLQNLLDIFFCPKRLKSKILSYITVLLWVNLWNFFTRLPMGYDILIWLMLITIVTHNLFIYIKKTRYSYSYSWGSRSIILTWFVSYIKSYFLTFLTLSFWIYSWHFEEYTAMSFKWPCLGDCVWDSSCVAPCSVHFSQCSDSEMCQWLRCGLSGML